MADESDLNVRSFSIQQLYNLHRAGRFIANRRYQRKLVWSVDEKRRLIDSAIKQLPIPLILVAEKSGEVIPDYEVIDGLQRLNAITSFIENEYQIEGGYFDLESLADTKDLSDQAALSQKYPKLSRDDSRALANYTLALSVFRSDNDEIVDEIFRRINSSGRKLSSQDLRQAGSTSNLASLVREISAQVRGDVSRTDLVPLSLMSKLSISNSDLDYGIDVDTIYWVQEGVLNRENIRGSRDEELVLDIVADMLSTAPDTSSSKTRNALFNFTNSDNPEPTRQSLEIESAIRIRTPESIRADFDRTFDELRRITDASGMRFCDLIGIGSRNPIPRYFHCVFMAVHELLISDGREFKDYSAAAARLREKYQRFGVQGSGGDWSGQNKADAIETVKSLLRTATVKSTDGVSAIHGRATFVERLLASSRVEHQLFEIKQGFLPVEHGATDQGPMVEKIARTASAMANTTPGVSGYIIVGVADTDGDVARIEEVDGCSALSYSEFRIVGLSREAARVPSRTLSQYWDSITRQLRTFTGLDEELGQALANRATLVPYHGSEVAVFEVQPGSRPYFFDTSLLERAGSETITVPQSRYGEVFRRFDTSSSA